MSHIDSDYSCPRYILSRRIITSVMCVVNNMYFAGYISKWMSKLRSKVAVRTDERVRLMSEIVSGIQVIKMYTWEKPFQGLVSCARKSVYFRLSLLFYPNLESSL